MSQLIILSITSTLPFWQVAPHKLLLGTKDSLVHVEQEVALICRLETVVNSAHFYVLIKADILMQTVKLIQAEEEKEFSTCLAVNLDSPLSCLVYCTCSVLLDPWYMARSCCFTRKSSHCSRTMAVAKLIGSGWKTRDRIPSVRGSFPLPLLLNQLLGPERTLYIESWQCKI
jgi:hypothetical protein